MQLKLLIFFILCCLACNNKDEVVAEQKPSITKTVTVFDKEKWLTKQGKDYPYRDNMLASLFANDTIRELDKNEVIDLLGPPDRIDSLYLFYLIAQKRAAFFPLHTKTLVIKISDDNSPNKIMIHE